MRLRCRSGTYTSAGAPDMTRRRNQSRFMATVLSAAALIGDVDRRSICWTDPHVLMGIQAWLIQEKPHTRATQAPDDCLMKIYRGVAGGGTIGRGALVAVELLEPGFYGLRGSFVAPARVGHQHKDLLLVGIEEFAHWSHEAGGQDAA